MKKLTEGETRYGITIVYKDGEYVCNRLRITDSSENVWGHPIVEQHNDMIRDIRNIAKRNKLRKLEVDLTSFQ